MSQMTKFLQQSCSLEKAKRTSDGKVALNKFGDVLYNPPVVLKCRREHLIKDVQTSTGAILQSSTRYFTDEKIPIEADDRIDGKVVLQAAEYVVSQAKVVGFESYV